MPVSLIPIQYSTPHSRNLPDPETCNSGGCSLEIDGCYITQDFWKLTTDGRLLNDNDADLYLTNENGDYLDKDGKIVDKSKAVKLIDTETTSISQSLIQYVGMERATEMLGVNPADLGNYDNQTLMDVLGMSKDHTAIAVLNGQTSFDSLSLDQQQKLVGELLMKNQGLSWSDSDKWSGEKNGEFKITDDWDGYSIGFDQTMTNGEYDKFVVDRVIDRNVLSYLGSRDSKSRNIYNSLDESIFYKKRLDGSIVDSFSESVQSVDNIFGSDQSFNHPIWGTIQGNTLAANSDFFTRFGQSSDSFKQMVFVNHDARTIDGGYIGSDGNWIKREVLSNANRSGRTLDHQQYPKNPSEDYLNSGEIRVDGCVGYNDWNSAINQLNSWGLYSGYDFKSRINNNWEAFSGYYGY